MIGLVAALIVAALLWLLVSAVRDIDRSVAGLNEIAGKVGANTANIPKLEATAPVLAQIVDEAVVQDGYMNALTDGYRRTRRSAGLVSTATYIVLSVVLAVVVIAVLAVALIEVRRRLESISTGLATLGDALTGVEAEHLRPLEPAVTAINAAVRRDPRRAARDRPQGLGRRGAEARTMTAVVDRRRRAAARRRARGRLPAARRADRGAEHLADASTRSPASPRPARRTSTPPRCS